jgi:hypothetical protein
MNYRREGIALSKLNTVGNKTKRPKVINKDLAITVQGKIKN